MVNTKLLFNRYYKLSGASEKWIRLTKITQHICSNSNAITAMLPFFTTLILDKNNNLKLIRLNYKGKIQIVPMPFELAPKDLEGIDFKTLSEYKISRTSRLYEAYYEE